jgi:hypothetical protein
MLFVYSVYTLAILNMQALKRDLFLKLSGRNFGIRETSIVI